MTDKPPFTKPEARGFLRKAALREHFRSVSYDREGYGSLSAGTCKKWKSIDLVANCVLDHSQPCTCGAEAHNIYVEAAMEALNFP